MLSGTTPAWIVLSPEVVRLHLQAEHGMRFLHVRQLAPEQPEPVQYTLWRATLVRAGSTFSPPAGAVLLQPK